MILPLILLQLSLVIFSIIDISKKGVKNLSPLIWILIVIFVNFFGPIIYILFGRNGHVDDYES
jgi:hypothetical protein